MTAAVVRGREDCEEVAASESLKAVHDALVRPQNVLHFIAFKEVLHAVWPKLDDVARTVGVSDEVGLQL